MPGRVQPSAAPDHLVEGDGRADVPEEYDVADGGDVDARREEIHRGGDEVAAGGAAQVGHQVAAGAGRRALECVGLQARPPVAGAPGGVEVVQGGGHVVRVAIPGAEDDRLLRRPAGGQQLVEEILGHGLHAIRQEYAVFEGRGIVADAGLAHRQGFPGEGVGERLVLQVGPVDAGGVQVDVAADDLACGQIAVLDPLGHVVLVNRLAEVRHVIGGEAEILLGLRALFGRLEPAWGGREADLDRVGIAGEDEAPLAPR